MNICRVHPGFFCAPGDKVGIFSHSQQTIYSVFRRKSAHLPMRRFGDFAKLQHIPQARPPASLGIRQRQNRQSGLHGSRTCVIAIANHPIIRKFNDRLSQSAGLKQPNTLLDFFNLHVIPKPGQNCRQSVINMVNARHTNDKFILLTVYFTGKFTAVGVSANIIGVQITAFVLYAVIQRLKLHLASGIPKQVIVTV